MNINWNDPNFQGFGRSREPRQPRERKAVGTPLGRTLLNIAVTLVFAAVYYVQYAHARICTLLKNLAAEGYAVPKAAEADLSVLTGEEEKALIKQLAQYPAVVLLAARDYDPSFINRYLSELAAAFHKFYNACRIKGEAENVLLARLKLADTARAVLKNGMTLIGCSAPEKM